MTGMMQVPIAPAWIERWLGQSAGQRGIYARFVAGILTPGGPLVSFPIRAVLYKSGASLSLRVTHLTSWSLFGFQRILARELPSMGSRLFLARVAPTLGFPIVAGYLARFTYRERRREQAGTRTDPSEAADLGV